MGFGIKPWYLEVRLEVHFVRYTCLDICINKQLIGRSHGSRFKLSINWHGCW